MSDMVLKEYVNRQRLLDTFLELIKINSPSFEEREIGELLIKRLREAGCSVEVQKYDRSFNLIAAKKGKREDSLPLLLSAHMDTIEPTEGIAYSIENDVVRTSGDTVLGADDKSAIAQILEAVTVLGEKKVPHGDLEIVFTSAEEKGLCGARNLDMNRLRSRYALVLDTGGNIGNVVIAAPTHHTYEMRIAGRAAHAGIEPEKGINAIRVASRIITEAPDGRIDEETTANIGMISGGTATNVVPKEAVIHGEFRSHDTGVLERLKRIFFEAAQRISREHNARITISEDEEYQAFRIDEHEPFLTFIQGIYKACGMEPALVVTGGGSDANLFNRKGILAVNISTGMQKPHSTEEHICLEDLYNGCRVVLQTIAEFPDFKIKEL